MEAQTIARACGKSHVHNLEPEDLCALTIEASAMARVPLAGTTGSLDAAFNCVKVVSDPHQRPLLLYPEPKRVPSIALE